VCVDDQCEDECGDEGQECCGGLGAGGECAPGLDCQGGDCVAD
jgi:hypothetical protein